ncbi:MAG: hypothetical protein HQL50_07380 [Magnetococcales bacterium]|nr:hypothetical protein [Magnetococcales bacterium]
MKNSDGPDRNSIYTRIFNTIKNIFFIIVVLPLFSGILLGVYMGGKSWMEKRGWIDPGYSAYAYCVEASDQAIFDQQSPLPGNKVFHKRILLSSCQARDQKIDGGDGLKAGKVRWYLCYGIDCDEGWANSFHTD